MTTIGQTTARKRMQELEHTAHLINTAGSGMHAAVVTHRLYIVLSLKNLLRVKMRETTQTTNPVYTTWSRTMKQETWQDDTLRYAPCNNLELAKLIARKPRNVVDITARTKKATSVLQDALRLTHAGRATIMWED